MEIPLLLNLKNIFTKDKSKINTWTHLFRKFNKNITLMHCMSEYEQSEEFCNGVLESLESAKENFTKLLKKIRIEKQNQKSINKKPIAWELSTFNNQELNNINASDIYNDLEDIEKVNFQLLAQLITEKKMSVQEALVLLVRESALALNENSNQQHQYQNMQGLQCNSLYNQQFSNISGNNSFMSKCSFDILEQFKEIGPEESEELHNNQQNNQGGITINQINQFQDEDNINKQLTPNQNDLIINQNNSNSNSANNLIEFKKTKNNSNQGNKSRSLTPNRMSLEQIFKRLVFKYNNKNPVQEQDNQLKDKLTEKQLKAQTIREQYIEINKKDFIKKEKQKQDLIKKKIDEKKQEQLKSIQQKLNLAFQRYEENVNQKVRKAKNQNEKAKEIAFIEMLENQNKRLTLNEKIQETKMRKKIILEQISNKKKMEREQKEEQAEKKRLEQHKMKELKAKIKLNKYEQADNRRAQYLNKEIKKQSDQQLRIKQIMEKIKSKKLKETNIKTQKKNQKEIMKEKLFQDQILLNNLMNQNNQNIQQQTKDTEHSFSSISDVETIISSFDVSDKDTNILSNRVYNHFSADNSVDYSYLKYEQDQQQIVFYIPKKINQTQQEFQYSLKNQANLPKNFIKSTTDIFNQFKQKKQNDYSIAKDSSKKSKKQNHKKVNKNNQKENLLKKNNTKQLDYSVLQIDYKKKYKSLPPLQRNNKGQFDYEVNDSKKRFCQKFKLNRQKKLIIKQYQKDQIENFSGFKENNSSKYDTQKLRDSYNTKLTPAKNIFNANQNNQDGGIVQIKNKFLFKTMTSQSSQDGQFTVNFSSINQNSSQVNKEEQKQQINTNSSLLFLKQSEEQKEEQNKNQQQQQQQQQNNNLEFKEQNQVQNKSEENKNKEQQQENQQNVSLSELEETQSVYNSSSNLNDTPINENSKQKRNTVNNLQNESLENSNQQYKWCSICDITLPNCVSIQEHLQSKPHKKTKNMYSLSQTDDSNSIICFQHIEELNNERLSLLKKKCKKIKQRMAVKCMKHEKACIIGKESTSPNKLRIQKICLDLEKLCNQQMTNYELMENCFKELIKVLDQRKEADLHVLRQVRFIPILIDIFKKVTIIQKNEINDYVKILEISCVVLQIFCGQIDNRTYLILSNRPLAIIELLNWALHRPTRFVYSLNFIPILFTILIMILKHKLPSQHYEIKEGIFEYIFFSGFLQKIKIKFMTFYQGIDLSIGKGKVPLALIKSVALIECIANQYSIGILKNQIRHSDNKQAQEAIIFVLRETELCGIVNLVAATILEQGAITKNPQKILPQTIVSLTMIGIRFLNNIARISLELLQSQLTSTNNKDQIYHIFNFLVTYCHQNYNHSEDVKDLLNEVILLIGYFGLLNKDSQDQLCNGSKPIVKQLADLPPEFFFEKKLKDILFPTLIILCFNNERSSKIILQDMNTDHLINFINQQKEQFNYSSSRQQRFLQNLETQQQQKDLQDIKQKVNNQNQNLKDSEYDKDNIEKKENYQKNLQQLYKYQNMFKDIIDGYNLEGQQDKLRSVSISSTCSSQNSVFITQSSNQFYLFPSRFPIELWENAINWLKYIDEII